MFDTIIFDQPIPCIKCGVEVRSDQTKAFECTLDRRYRVGDTFGRARGGDPHRRRRSPEGATRAKRSPRATTWRSTAAAEGVVGIEQEREAAEALLRNFNFEKLLLWYHDLYHKRRRALADNRRAEAFMRQVCPLRGSLTSSSRAAATSRRRKAWAPCASS